MSDNLEQRVKDPEIPKEAEYPRSEVKKINGKMIEYYYVDKQTMISREVESSRAKLTIQP